MDVFSRSFLPTADEFGLPAAMAARHLPVLRQCVEGDDAAVLVTRCRRPSRPMSGEYLLLLTTRRLVITHESRILRRMSLHLNANLRHLSNVTWTADQDSAGFVVAATAVDEVRERFWMNLGGRERVQQVESLFQRVFAGLSAARLRTLEAVNA